MEEKELRLEPFIHQVGGHSPLFCLDTETVCKPHVLREHNFYSSLPQDIQPFTPHFKGIMKVQISEDADGYITMKGYPPLFYTNCRQSAMDEKPKMRLKRCGSIEIESEIPSDQYFEDEGGPGERMYNPWALKCHRDNLRKIGITLNPEVPQDTWKNQEYILLENLTAKYHYPCVLDLKVGTRQYGDSATSTKKLSKTAKVAGTTSGVLGLRLGGMQVYQASLGRYICRTKNYGRSLTVQGLKMALREFFCNGLVMRVDVIRGLIRKLVELKRVLETLDSFRFYTSSLLVTYDGRTDRMGCRPLDPRLAAADRKTRNSVSTGSLLLASGKRLACDSNQKAVSLGELNICHEHAASHKTVISERKRSLSYDSVTKLGQLSHAGRQLCHAGRPTLPSRDLYDFVDVRIIDFAHSTHRGLNDSTVHEGPDRGFLFGLDNFITTLQEMEV